MYPNAPQSVVFGSGTSLYVIAVVRPSDEVAGDGA